MEDRKSLLFGIWAIIAIAAIVLLVLIVMKWNISGAFAASQSYAEIGPAALCEENGCSYLGHVFPTPNFGPGRVDCLCKGG